jgi:tetratricopeptide (TPR) repeat protein
MRNTVIEETAFGPTPYSDADDLIEKAWEAATPAKQVKLARKALEIDLDCIDAYILLSHHAETLGERLALLREAVRAGDRLWKPYKDVEDMAWWGFIGTRPYMRALHELGLSYEEAGDREETQACFADLLKLNPNDNQGVRELLAHSYLMQGRYDEAKGLCEKYPEDFMIGMRMTELACALKSGKKTSIEKAIISVRQINDAVIPLAIASLAKGKKPRSTGGEYRQAGSKEEAADYLDYAWDYWAQPRTKKRFLSDVENGTAKIALTVPAARKVKGPIQ